MIRHQAPADNEALRQSLYQGQVFLLEANVASRALGHAVRCLLLKHFGADYRLSLIHI